MTSDSLKWGEKQEYMPTFKPYLGGGGGGGLLIYFDNQSAETNSLNSSTDNPMCKLLLHELWVSESQLYIDVVNVSVRSLFGHSLCWHFIPCESVHFIIQLIMSFTSIMICLKVKGFVMYYMRNIETRIIFFLKVLGAHVYTRGPLRP